MERLRAGELEANLDRLCVAAARRAGDIDRRRADYEGAAAAHASLSAAHAEALSRAAALSARVSEGEGELAAERRLAAGLRQGLADKGRQLAVLTAEVERLQGRGVAMADDEAGAVDAGALDPASVISARLVTFTSLAALVEKNGQLLAVARSLADDLDAARAGVDARFAESRAAEAAETERRIAQLTDVRRRGRALCLFVCLFVCFFVSLFVCCCGAPGAHAAAAVRCRRPCAPALSTAACPPTQPPPPCRPRPPDGRRAHRGGRRMQARRRRGAARPPGP